MKTCTVLWRNLSRCLFLIFFLAFSLSLTVQAFAQGTALEQVVSLSKEALGEYDDFELETADAKISEAVGLIEVHLLTGKSVANVFLAQGIIGYGRFKDSAPAIAEDRAFSAFLNAVAHHSDVELPVDYATSELEDILDNARAALEGQVSSEPLVAPPSISHSPVLRASRCVASEVVARVPSHPDVYRVMLFYQSNHSGRYESLEMQPDFSDTSKLSAEISAADVNGDELLYYIEVYDRQTSVVANVGSRSAPLKTVLSGECASEKVYSDSDPLFQMSFAIGTGVGLVKGMTENCNSVGSCSSAENQFKGVSLGVAPVPLFLRANAIFNLPQNFQLGVYLRGQVINIVKDQVQPHLMVGLALRYLVLSEQPYRLYIGLEMGWGGANATVFLGKKFNNFRDVYIFEGPFHVAPQIGFLWSFHRNVGLIIDLSIPIHFPTHPRVHFDLSVGPFFQF